MCTITIFTPTFNRGYCLDKIYNSLVNQKCNDFLWLVVDDGSTDNTSQLIHSWIDEARIKIRYIYQENGGKHRAHNNAVKNCSTDYFYCVDSDDILPDNSIETILDWTRIINSNHSICGIIARRGHFDGNIDGCAADNIPEVISMRDLYDVYKFEGETALIFKTSVLRENLFPTIAGEKFVTEAVIYNMISMKYDSLFRNSVVYIYDYKKDGYSINICKHIGNSPRGYAIYLKQLSEIATYSKSRLIYRIKLCLWCKIHRIPYREYIEKTNMYQTLCLLLANTLFLLKLPRSWTVYYSR